MRLHHVIFVSLLLQNFYVKATIPFLIELHVVLVIVIFSLKDISDPDRQIETNRVSVTGVLRDNSALPSASLSINAKALPSPPLPHTPSTSAK